MLEHKWIQSFFILMLAAFLLGVEGKSAQGPSKKTPVLRYVSLKVSNARLHSGPGTKYPTLWEYVKKDIPLEVVAEYEHWRKVRDIDGGEGWLHKSSLSSKRVVWVISNQASLYRSPEEKSRLVAQLGAGVFARLIDLHKGWCKVEVKAESGVYRGWVHKDTVWGLLPQDA